MKSAPVTERDNAYMAGRESMRLECLKSCERCAKSAEDDWK